MHYVITPTSGVTGIALNGNKESRKKEGKRKARANEGCLCV